MLYQKRRIFLVGALVLSAGLSEAQVHRTFVSVNGNDGNDEGTQKREGIRNPGARERGRS